jgi:hypothetical protein
MAGFGKRLWGAIFLVSNEGVEQDQKDGVAEVSANRGWALTHRGAGAKRVLRCADAKQFVEQTQKKGLSEVSANRGCLLTKRA